MSPPRELFTRPLPAKRLRQVLPLVRFVHPGWTEGAWESFARDHLCAREPGNGGCYMVEDQNGTILGVMIYEVHRNRPGEPELEVKQLIAMDSFLSGRLQIASRLVNAAEEAARFAGCLCVRVSVREALGDPLRGWWVSFLEGQGYGVGGPHLSKQILSH